MEEDKEPWNRNQWQCVSKSQLKNINLSCYDKANPTVNTTNYPKCCIYMHSVRGIIHEAIWLPNGVQERLALWKLKSVNLYAASGQGQRFWVEPLVMWEVTTWHDTDCETTWELPRWSFFRVLCLIFFLHEDCRKCSVYLFCQAINLIETT